MGVTILRYSRTFISHEQFGNVDTTTLIDLTKSANVVLARSSVIPGKTEGRKSIDKPLSRLSSELQAVLG